MCDSTSTYISMFFVKHYKLTIFETDFFEKLLPGMSNYHDIKTTLLSYFLALYSFCMFFFQRPEAQVVFFLNHGTNPEAKGLDKSSEPGVPWCSPTLFGPVF